MSKKPVSNAPPQILCLVSDYLIPGLKDEKTRGIPERFLGQHALNANLYERLISDHRMLDVWGWYNDKAKQKASPIRMNDLSDFYRRMVDHKFHRLVFGATLFNKYTGFEDKGENALRHTFFIFSIVRCARFPRKPAGMTRAERDVYMEKVAKHCVALQELLSDTMFDEISVQATDTKVGDMLDEVRAWTEQQDFFDLEDSLFLMRQGGRRAEKHNVILNLLEMGVFLDCKLPPAIIAAIANVALNLYGDELDPVTVAKNIERIVKQSPYITA